MCCSKKRDKLNCTCTLQYRSSFCSVMSLFVLYECRKTSTRKYSTQMRENTPLKCDGAHSPKDAKTPPYTHIC